MTSVALKTTLEIKLGNCSSYIKRHFCIDPMTMLVSHQAAPHILQQNCAHVPGVTISDSNQPHPPKFLTPSPVSKNLRIWEFESCSDIGYYQCNRNSGIFHLRNAMDHAKTWFWRKRQMTPFPVFRAFWHRLSDNLSLTAVAYAETFHGNFHSEA